MTEALFWGLVAGSSIVIGGFLALVLTIPKRVLGVVMAFGAGVLISAVAYELVQEAVETTSNQVAVASGLFAGALAFAVGDELLERHGARDRKRSEREPGGSGLAIVLGIVLDGIPESVVIGLSLLGGQSVSAAVIVAVFLSNLPEAIGATAGLRKSGWTASHVMWLWVAVALVTALAAMAGYGLFQDATPGAVAFVLAFAGGAILTMLAQTMMPEAFAYGGRLVGLATTLGFAVAFAISALE